MGGYLLGFRGYYFDLRKVFWPLDFAFWGVRLKNQALDRRKRLKEGLLWGWGEACLSQLKRGFLGWARLPGPGGWADGDCCRGWDFGPGGHGKWEQHWELTTWPPGPNGSFPGPCCSPFPLASISCLWPPSCGRPRAQGDFRPPSPNHVPAPPPLDCQLPTLLSLALSLLAFSWVLTQRGEERTQEALGPCPC